MKTTGRVVGMAVVVAGAVSVLASCAIDRGRPVPVYGVAPTTGPATQPTTTTTEVSEVKSAWMFKEAKLPEGFPPPGPVGKVVVKKYPAYRAARLEAGAVERTQDSMFRVLFNHIKENKIKMTAPVEMTYDEAGDRAERPAAMAFLYASPEVGKAGEAGRVEVVDVPAATVVSVAVRGSYSDGHYREGLAKVREYLGTEEGRRWEAAGPPRYLGYNSPFVPWFMRLGEVQVPVRERAGGPG